MKKIILFIGFGLLISSCVTTNKINTSNVDPCEYIDCSRFSLTNEMNQIIVEDFYNNDTIGKKIYLLKNHN